MKVLIADKPEDIDNWPSAEEVFRPMLEAMKKEQEEKENGKKR